MDLDLHDNFVACHWPIDDRVFRADFFKSDFVQSDDCIQAWVNIVANCHLTAKFHRGEVLRRKAFLP